MSCIRHCDWEVTGGLAHALGPLISASETGLLRPSWVLGQDEVMSRVFPSNQE